MSRSQRQRRNGQIFPPTLPPIMPSTATASAWIPPSSPDSCYSTASTGPSPRTPPIDARKMRRHCTDFGLAAVRAKLASLDDDEDTCSTDSSTPITMTSNSSSSSIGDIRQLDFPEPPPLDHVIRRMKSSPSCTTDIEIDFASVSQLLASRRRCTVSSTATAAPPTRQDRWISGSVPKSSVWLDEEYGEQLLRENQAQHDRWTNRRQPQPIAVQHRRFASAAAPASAYSYSASNSYQHARAHSHAHARAQSQSHSQVQQIVHRTVPKMRSLKFAPECTESLEHLQVSMEKVRGPSNTLRGRSMSMEFSSHARRHPGPPPSQPLPVPLPRHRANLSVPYFSRHAQDAETTRVHVHAQATPVLHHHYQQPRVQYQQQTTAFPAYSSYIDITPEQIRPPSMTVNKQRIRKLIARASSGVVAGWSRILRTKAL